MTRVTTTLTVSLLLCGLTLNAAAQTGADTSRAQFDAGRSALDAGRFAEARDRFRESLETSPRVATAFNLAVALRGTGESLAALAVFDALIAGTYGEVSARLHEEVAGLRAEAVAEIGTVQVHLDGATQANLFCNGRACGAIEDGGEILLDPGRHVISAEADGRRSSRRALTLRRGARQVLTLTFDSAATGRITLEADEGAVEIVGVESAQHTLQRSLPPGDYEIRWTHGDETETQQLRLTDGANESIEFGTTPLVQRPWFWVLIGVAVIGATTAMVLLARPGDSRPQNDGVFGVTEALTASW